MTIHLANRLGPFLLCTALAACSRKAPAPKAEALADTARPADTGEGGDGKLAPNDPKHGSRRLMGLDTPVFVDGVQVAVLRFGELPDVPTEKTEAGTLQFRLHDYLTAIGVDPKIVASVHLHGNGDRIASVEGRELVRDKARFRFQFAGGTTGAALQRWDTEGLANAFVIHEFRKVSIYVKKPVPGIHPKRQCHVTDTGECTDAVPYAQGEMAKGTRVYVDGKLVGAVKRRQISDKVVVGEQGGEHTYSVAKLVAEMGVDAMNVETVELVAGDTVIGRAARTEWQAMAGNLTFVLPKHSHGKIRVHVPAAVQAKDEGPADRDAMVSAVMIYKRAKPATFRELHAISEDTDMSVQLASSEAARGRGEQ